MKKIPNTPQELIRELPSSLKELFWKQWNVPQNPKWHPEGNTLKHILVTIKRAYEHYPEDPNMILAALFHDLGKLDVFKINPKTGQPSAYGHEKKSVEILDNHRDYINSFEGTDFDIIRDIVKYHMVVKPDVWNNMREFKRNKISTIDAYPRLTGFTNNVDGGGLE